MTDKVPSGTLSVMEREINIDTNNICFISKTFEKVEINDVLESILILLKYIKKYIANKDFVINIRLYFDDCGKTFYLETLFVTLIYNVDYEPP